MTEVRAHLPRRPLAALWAKPCDDYFLKNKLKFGQ